MKNPKGYDPNDQRFIFKAAKFYREHGGDDSHTRAEVMHLYAELWRRWDAESRKRNEEKSSHDCTAEALGEARAENERLRNRLIELGDMEPPAEEDDNYGEFPDDLCTK